MPNRDDIPLEDGYTRVVANKSGVIDIHEWRDGVWIAIEDANSICSIGLNAKELAYLIDYLTACWRAKIRGVTPDAKD